MRSVGFAMALARGRELMLLDAQTLEVNSRAECRGHRCGEHLEREPISR
jgi:hypothetical protein